MEATEAGIKIMSVVEFKAFFAGLTIDVPDDGTLSKKQMDALKTAIAGLVDSKLSVTTFR